MHDAIKLRANQGILNGEDWVSIHLPNGAGNAPATAPYNFVPLPEKVVVQSIDDLPKHDAFTSGLLTGEIACTLTTKTPLYVRGASTVDNYSQDTQTPQPFTHGDADRPSIPSSTIRGAIRSVFQIATYSKPEIKDERQFSGRFIGDRNSAGAHYRQRFLTDLPGLSPADHKHAADARAALHQHVGITRHKFNVRAGYIELRGDQVLIRPATVFRTADPEVGDVSFFRIAKETPPPALFPHFEPVWFDQSTIDSSPHRHGTIAPGLEWKRLVLRYALVKDWSRTKKAGWAEGTLVRTGGLPRKKLQYVFNPVDPHAAAFDVTALARGVIEGMSASKAVGENVEPREALLDPSNKAGIRDGCPIFYLADGGDVTAFGYTMMFRLPFEHPASAHVPDYGILPNEVDLTSAVFGWVREGEQGAAIGSRKGRVRFTSARCTAPSGSDILMGEITPKILGEPKPAAFPHYLEQQQTNTAHLAHFADSHPTAIRGFKRYWPVREGLVNESLVATPEELKSPDSQFTKITPVKAGVPFTFRIRFNNLRREELGALLWALEPNARSGHNPEIVHQLGMAKALGLGSVSILAGLSLDQRRGKGGRYSRLFSGPDWHTAREAQAASVVDDLKSRFESTMDAALGLTPDRSYLQQERIQDLIAMMDAGAPARNRTSLKVSVKKGKQSDSEFKSRRVLPSPRQVAKDSGHKQ